ncbi:hypothetical protein I7I51_00951 [Histoplasma capsulatum]|uniref:Uncharacterized protein n=1 Tax=Ajellomyces capsulatus TaxID=5037 RepID=A0A8A1MD89_AJECA|nr:hypothetical protein I7I51_00951 [Histoplasma capsulatum]
MVARCGISIWLVNCKTKAPQESRVIEWDGGIVEEWGNLLTIGRLLHCTLSLSRDGSKCTDKDIFAPKRIIKQGTFRAENGSQHHPIINLAVGKSIKVWSDGK